MVANQLKTYLSVRNLHNPKQSAYRKGHSTESALLSVGNDVQLNLAKGESTALVLLDLSAAFDTKSCILDMLLITQSYYTGCQVALAYVGEL